MEFSPEQNKVINTWNQSIAVVAGAGSGKTTTIVQKCRILLEKNPEARICAISFTEKSARDLFQRIAKFTDISKHKVSTIHGLCRTIIQDYPQFAGCDGGETILTESDGRSLWEAALERLWFDAVPDSVEESFQRLLKRETRPQLMKLIDRVKGLKSFGVLGFLLNSKDQETKDLGIVSEYALSLFDRSKIKKGVLDFDDLETFAKQILTHAAPVKDLQSRFDLVLVDEFQDTNPIQASIVRAICKPKLKNLCVVGDPKQSIYRFRDADVSLFEEWCKEVDVRIDLDWNFRSHEKIIHFINDVCEPTFEASQLNYQSLVPKKESEEQKPLEKWKIYNPGDFAQALKNEIDEGLNLSESVLLLRRIRGSEKWIRALSSKGIPIAIGSGGLFWEDPRVRELVAFLRSWQSSENRLSFSIFARAPWMGISDQKLDEWFLGGQEVWECFFGLETRLSKKLSKLRGSTLRPGELLEVLFEFPEIVDECGVHLMGLWHRCEALSYEGKSFREVCDHLRKAVEQSQRENSTPPPKSLDQLQVLTIHGSKGLEFKNVFIVDLEGKQRAKEMPMLFWDRNKGAFLGRRKADGDRDQKDELELSWRGVERSKELSESKRLFYVALTRAMERLILVESNPDPELIKRAQKPLEAPFESDSWKDWVNQSNFDLLVHSYEAIDTKSSEDSTPSKVQKNKIETSKVRSSLEKTRTRHAVTEWVTVSQCPRKYAYKESLIEPDSQPEQLSLAPQAKTSSASIDFSLLGTQVHRVLEHWSEDSLSVLSEIEQEFGKDFFSAQSLFKWASSKDYLNDPTFEVWKECAFETKVFESILVGAIDAIVRDPSGLYTIYDYKITGDHQHDERMVQNYRVQMQIYAWALSRLEPKAKNRTKVKLVRISPTSTRELEVDVGDQNKLENTIESLYLTVDQLIQGKDPTHNAGAQCRYCDFLDHCNAGRQVMNSF